jgi:hypothetical protein
MGEKKLNTVYTSPAMKRRYEVWFLRFGLADGSGAWWFRYLVMNLGRGNGATEATAMPAQVWATWFPRHGEPQSFIQGFPLEKLSLSRRKIVPFHCRIAENGIEEGRCWGKMEVDGHSISWNLRISSHFGYALSNKGWVGFSKSPHSDAAFSGAVQFDGMLLSGEPLGFGLQGHNCGYRHRTYWRWTHAYFPSGEGGASTLEALVYGLPLGMTFRKVVLWQGGKLIVLRKINEREIVSEDGQLKWVFSGTAASGEHVEATLEEHAPGIHRLPYRKTDGSGTFPVANASLARATVRIETAGTVKILETDGGAVLEMGGV